MRKASHWNTIRFHLAGLGRCVANWFDGFRVGCHDWVEQYVVAPEPVTAYERPAVKATVMAWAIGAGAICDDGEQAEFWVMGRNDAAVVEAYMSRIGIRWTEEVTP